MSLWISVVLIAVGLVLLAGGGEILVRSAVTLAEIAGVTPAVIGLTVVAIGTSLPELAVSALAAFEGQSDLAVGNVVGSNAVTILLFPILRSGARVSRLEGAVPTTSYVAYVGRLLTA